MTLYSLQPRVKLTKLYGLQYSKKAKFYLSTDILLNNIFLYRQTYTTGSEGFSFGNVLYPIVLSGYQVVFSSISCHFPILRGLKLLLHTSQMSYITRNQCCLWEKLSRWSLLLFLLLILTRVQLLSSAGAHTRLTAPQTYSNSVFNVTSPPCPISTYQSHWIFSSRHQ